MTLYSLGIAADFVAPDSENSTFSTYRIRAYKKKYKYHLVIFDNDVAGIKAMEKYKKLFDLPFCYLSAGNDPADIRKNSTFNEALINIVMPIQKALNKNYNE